MEFLGQHVSTEGICLLEARVAAITAHPQPATKSQLMSFLGMINFYRRYLSGAASILKPLTDATRGTGGKHSPLKWTKEMLQAFAAAKEALTKATHLAHPLQEAELSLAVDASDHHVGAALQQRPQGSALRHFRHLLEGRSFHVLTDHKPLVSALHRARDAWSARQGRHLAYF